jgi:hypothetical protein
MVRRARGSLAGCSKYLSYWFLNVEGTTRPVELIAWP